MAFESLDLSSRRSETAKQAPPARVHATKSSGLNRKAFDREDGAVFDALRPGFWQRCGLAILTNLWKGDSLQRSATALDGALHSGLSKDVRFEDFATGMPSKNRVPSQLDVPPARARKSVNPCLFTSGQAVI